jgi:hypothetical protein
VFSELYSRIGFDAIGEPFLKSLAISPADTPREQAEVIKDVLPFVGNHFPGATPGLLVGNTLVVRNRNITPDLWVSLPLAPMLPGDDNGNKTNPTLRDCFTLSHPCINLLSSFLNLRNQHTSCPWVAVQCEAIHPFC